MKNNNIKIEPQGWKELLHIAYPLILVNASNIIMQFTDRKFLSLLSTEDMAAALPAGMLCFTLFSFFSISIGFTSSIVAQYFGRRSYKRCAQVIWSSFYFSLIAGLICSYLMPYLGSYIIHFSKSTPIILSKEHDFFMTIMPAGGFACIMVAFCSFFSGRGKTLIVALIVFLGSIINCILAYSLIFGKFGVPALGITGAGLATTLSQGITTVIAGTFFFSMNQKIYPTRKFLYFNYADVKRILVFGFPTGIQVFIQVAAFTIIMFFIAYLGAAALVSTTIAYSINLIAFLPLIGMSDAAGIIVGKHIGRNRIDIAERQALLIIKISLTYTFLIALILVLFPNMFFGIFKPASSDIATFTEAIKYARFILICAASYNFFDALYFSSMGALRGAGDTKFPMYIAILGCWILWVPGVAICIFVLKLNIIGVWIYIALYIALDSLIIYFRFKRGKWKTINLIEPVSEH